MRLDLRRRNGSPSRPRRPTPGTVLPDARSCACLWAERKVPHIPNPLKLIYHPNSTLTSTRPTDATPPRKPLPPSPLPPSEAVDDVENEEQKDEDVDEQQQQRQKATPPVEVDRSCANCGAAEESANSGATTHRPCSRCKAAYYCSVKCQKEHWKAHKLTCVAPSATPMASAASAALAAAAAGRGRGDGTSGVARGGGGGGGGGGADTVVEGGGCGGYLYIYGGETYPGEADGVNPLDGLRGAGTTFDFFRLRLSSDMTEGVWEKRLVVGDHPGPLQEVHAGVLLNSAEPYSSSRSNSGGNGDGDGVEDEDEFGGAREQKILLFGGYRCWGPQREARHRGALGATSNTLTEPGPYLRDLHVYEHGAFRRLTLLRDGGVAKIAQNHVLPVTDRAFHSVHTRDVRRCPRRAASCSWTGTAPPPLRVSPSPARRRRPRSAGSSPPRRAQRLQREHERQYLSREAALVPALHASRQRSGRRGAWRGARVSFWRRR